MTSDTMRLVRQAFSIIFIPSLGQLLASLTAATLILAIVFEHLLVSVIAHGAYISDSDFYAVISNWLAQVNSLPFAEKSVIGIYWAVVGCGCYLVFLVVSNFIIELRNDVTIMTRFVNTGNYTLQLLRNTGVRALWVLGLVAFGALSLTLLLPVWLGWFSQPLMPHSLAPWWLSVIGFIGLTLNVYLLGMLAYISFHAADLRRMLARQ